MTQTWHPIETAPMDGTVFLALHDRSLGNSKWSAPYLVSWDVARPRINGYTACRGKPWWIAYDKIHLAPRPTHWMSLPKPPEGLDL